MKKVKISQKFFDKYPRFGTHMVDYSLEEGKEEVCVNKDDGRVAFVRGGLIVKVL